MLLIFSSNCGCWRRLAALAWFFDTTLSTVVHTKFDGKKIFHHHLGCQEDILTPGTRYPPRKRITKGQKSPSHLSPRISNLARDDLVVSSLSHNLNTNTPMLFYGPALSTKEIWSDSAEGRAAITIHVNSSQCKYANASSSLHY
jgi:hypothetical protein